jgi:hypothetical protein
MRNEQYRLSVDKNLTEWLKSCPDNLFPDDKGEAFKARYAVVSNHLEEIHRETEKGVMLEAMRKGLCDPESAPYYNNHGEAHVKRVIDRATELLMKSGCKVTPYEGYILLLAIEFHDVGMIFGRKEHEKKCMDVMDKLGSEIGDDTPEKRAIVKIAMVHCGHTRDGSRDTISKLDDYAMSGQRVRHRLLAAILRLSDELSDDRSRSSKLVTDLSIIPEDSMIFHLYSQSLHSVIIEKQEIQLEFCIEQDLALRKFKKDGKDVYLVDEIYDRTLKMYNELMYCMRFMRPDFDISRIRVSLNIFPKKSLIDEIKFGYSLEDVGYPNYHADGILKFFTDYKEYTGDRIRERILSMN